MSELAGGGFSKKAFLLETLPAVGSLLPQTALAPLTTSIHPRRDARGVVFEAFEAGQAFHVGAEFLQGVLGEVDVVGSGDEVVGAQGRGPGRGSPGRQGMGGGCGVVPGGDG